jgi:hypothetical protein
MAYEKQWSMHSQIVAIWADRSSIVLTKHGSDLRRLNRPVGIPLPEDPKPFGRPLLAGVTVTVLDDVTDFSHRTAGVDAPAIDQLILIKAS